MRLLELPVVTRWKFLLNPVTNPTPVSSHYNRHSIVHKKVLGHPSSQKWFHMVPVQVCTVSVCRTRENNMHFSFSGAVMQKTRAVLTCHQRVGWGGDVNCIQGAVLWPRLFTIWTGKKHIQSRGSLQGLVTKKVILGQGFLQIVRLSPASSHIADAPLSPTTIHHVSTGVASHKFCSTSGPYFAPR
jgi:hypothetical protein